MFGEEGRKFRERFKPILHEKKRLISLPTHLRTAPEVESAIALCEEKLHSLRKEYAEFSEPIFQKHIEIVNKYLAKFTDYISLTEFTYLRGSDEFEMFRIYPQFEVYDQPVIFSSPGPNSKVRNAQYSMSEGDKSAIALSFFLARLEITGISDKIIVFDDPLSSFDYARKNATIHQLAKIANDSVQLILLTHDLGFAHDFGDKCSFLDILNLKIENNGKSSCLAWHDIDSEFLTSTQKNLQVINDYLLNPANSGIDKHEVIRCIRPALEGVIKTKYFNLIPTNKWLGEIIELIKKSPATSRLYKINNMVQDLIELNDYTKAFHHSTGQQTYEHINPTELRRYVQLLMDVVYQI